MQVAATRIVLDEYHAEDSIEKPTVERLDSKEKKVYLWIQFTKVKETELSRNKKITENAILFIKACYAKLLPFDKLESYVRQFVCESNKSLSPQAHVRVISSI